MQVGSKESKEYEPEPSPIAFYQSRIGKMKAEHKRGSSRSAMHAIYKKASIPISTPTEPRVEARIRLLEMSLFPNIVNRSFLEKNMQ